MSAGFATAVIAAAGRGQRFGAAPKILAEVGGRPMVAWTLDAAELAVSVGEIVVVTAGHTAGAIQHLVDEGPWRKQITIVRGGAARHDSVMAGVRAVPNHMEIVLIHDAARPLVTSAMFDSCASAARLSGAAIVALPVSDTIKRVMDGKIVQTIFRGDLWSAQTPQCFRRQLLADAGNQAGSDTIEYTDEASLFELLGYTVVIVPGSSSNIKVTHPDDIHVADALLRRRMAQGSEIQCDDT